MLLILQLWTMILSFIISSFIRIVYHFISFLNNLLIIWLSSHLPWLIILFIKLCSLIINFLLLLNKLFFKSQWKSLIWLCIATVIIRGDLIRSTLIIKRLWPLIFFSLITSLLNAVISIIMFILYSIIVLINYPTWIIFLL